MGKFAVVAGYMTEHIYVGRTNKADNAFVQKEEATDMVLAAVAQYVIRNFATPIGGALHTTFPRLGIEMEVKVWPVDNKPVSGNEPECSCSFLGEHRVSSKGCPVHDGEDKP